MPHSATDDMLQFAGISRAEVDSARNCLLLAYKVEKAFDRLDISFVPVSVLQPYTYKLVIWTPRGLKRGAVRRKHPGDIRLQPLWQDSAIQIGQFEGRHLFCGENIVLKRALSNQACFAFLRARKRGWVSESEEAPIEFGSPQQSETEFRSSRLALLNAVDNTVNLGSGVPADSDVDSEQSELIEESGNQQLSEDDIDDD
jgi:hypothetical protein